MATTTIISMIVKPSSRCRRRWSAAQPGDHAVTCIATAEGALFGCSAAVAGQTVTGTLCGVVVDLRVQDPAGSEVSRVPVASVVPRVSPRSAPVHPAVATG